MYRFGFQLLSLAPGSSAIGRLEKSAGVFVLMSGDVDDFGITRVDDDVIQKKLRTIKVVKQAPALAAVRGSIKLTVERAEIKALRVLRVKDERAHIAARRACASPVHSILRRCI